MDVLSKVQKDKTKSFRPTKKRKNAVDASKFFQGQIVNFSALSNILKAKSSFRTPTGGRFMTRIQINRKGKTISFDTKKEAILMHQNWVNGLKLDDGTNGVYPPARGSK